MTDYPSDLTELIHVSNDLNGLNLLNVALFRFFMVIIPEESEVNNADHRRRHSYR
jgi:hypothetical protein